MKNKNWLREEILKQLFLSGTVTRPELIRELEVRPATLFEVIDAMKDEGILCEPDRRGKRTGRKASPLCFNEDYAYFSGLELQPDYVIGVVINLAGKERLMVREGIKGDRNQENAKKAIIRVLHRLQESDALDWRLCRGVGFADPGLVDLKQKRAIVAVNIEGWRFIDIDDLLEEHTGIGNIHVCSATMARTYMEYQELLPKRPESLFHMEIGKGIGGGFINNGELFAGAMNCGMEIGHLIVEPEGPLCQCGNRGCLEAVAAEQGIRRRVQDLLDHNVNTMLKDREFSIKYFIKAVEANDKAARMLANEISVKIAMGLQCIVAILNPAMIVLSGELTGLGKILIQTIRDFLELNCMPTAINGLELRVSALQEKGTAQGVALMTRDALLFRR